MMPKFEPVRWYAIVAAALSIVAYYIEIPEELFAALAAAVLVGGGEVVRSQVTTTAKLSDVADHDDEVVGDAYESDA